MITASELTFAQRTYYSQAHVANGVLFGILRLQRRKHEQGNVILWEISHCWRLRLVMNSNMSSSKSLRHSVAIYLPKNCSHGLVTGI
jgi:hypothetical protein